MEDASQQTADYLGLYTDDFARYDVTGQAVRWVAWDSPASDLAAGDLVLAVEGAGRRLEGADVPRLSYPPGGTSALWSALGCDPGTPLTFTVARDGDTLYVSVGAIPQRFYQSLDGKRSLFPGGPYALSRAEIGETWSTWYERIIKAWSLILCDGWRQRSFKTRELLKQHADEFRAVEYLEQHHPGQFAENIAARWRDVERVLAGSAFADADVDLGYREVAAERRDKIKAAGVAAHAAYEDENSESLEDAFPAPDPYETDAGSVAGRLVVIDRVSPRDMRNDGVQAWYMLGDRQKGWYFLDANSAPAMRMHIAIDEYKLQVTPHLGESYRMYLRVTEEPMIRAKEARNVALGFKVELVAAFVGRELFISGLDTETPVVAGSEHVSGAALHTPPPDAEPEALARYRIDAIKKLRRDRWEALFADWKVTWDFAANPVFLPYGEIGPSDKRSGWEQSRKRLFDDIFDVRVLGASKPHVVLAQDPGDGTPCVEECEVLVEHVGRFDGEYRSFKDSWLTRAWRLQRVDDGPWRFVFPRAL